MNQPPHHLPPAGPPHQPYAPYAAPPAYAYAYAPVPAGGSSPSGFNPWVAGLLGGIVGATVTGLLALVVALGMGMPMPWEGPDDWVDDWTGQVDVASDGSVLGFALADAVDEVGGGGYYEEVVCADTAEVAEDVTTLCDVDDGFDRYRVVVVFLDADGAFETAELLTP